MKSLHKNKRGLVSIIVVIVIILIITLIVLAFAALVRREQRQSLDRQLNTQAFYAAEAGINDAINAIKTIPALSTFDSGGDCALFSSLAYANLTPALGDGTTSYSCLLVDTSPASLVYDEVGRSQSQVVPLRHSGGLAIDEIKISWQDKEGGTNFSGCPPSNTNVFNMNWPLLTCSPGIMRVDIVPFNGAKSREQLITDSGVVYLVPKDGAASATSIAFSSFGGSAVAQGLVANVECNAGATPRHCVATITGLNITTGYLRLKSIYKSSTVTITARNVASNTQLDLVGVQAIIDVTGKANDILKRVQVRVPLFTNDPAGEFALEIANTICKKLINNGSTITIDLSFAGVSDCDPYQDPSTL